MGKDNKSAREDEEYGTPPALPPKRNQPSASHANGIVLHAENGESPEVKSSSDGVRPAVPPRRRVRKEENVRKFLAFNFSLSFVFVSVGLCFVGFFLFF